MRTTMNKTHTLFISKESSFNLVLRINKKYRYSPKVFSPNYLLIPLTTHLLTVLITLFIQPNITSTLITNFKITITFHFTISISSRIIPKSSQTLISWTHRFTVRKYSVRVITHTVGRWKAYRFRIRSRYADNGETPTLSNVYVLKRCRIYFVCDCIHWINELCDIRFFNFIFYFFILMFVL